MRAAVAYGFGGNAGVGAAQAGFEIATWKCEEDAFGLWAVERNRSHLPGEWQAQATEPRRWTPVQAGLLIGTPPCAAFSSVNFGSRSTTRGIDSSWNNCMRNFVEYASRCTGEDERRGPEVVAFESVAAAYSKGLPLMQKLQLHLRNLTNEDYRLTHVRVTNASLGSAQLRRRYWFVASRIGELTLPTPAGRVTTARDRIGDLEEVAAAPGLPTLIPDHEVFNCSRLACGCRPEMWECLEPGDHCRKGLARYVERHGRPLNGFETRYERMQRQSWIGYPFRINGDGLAPVLTGQCLQDVLHYAERRHITAREGLRLMGMPDTWTLGSVPVSKAQNVIGKAAPVESCRWISQGARALLEGRRLEVEGEPFADLQRLIYVP